jgi:hypothetical protein
MAFSCVMCTVYSTYRLFLQVHPAALGSKRDGNTDSGLVVIHLLVAAGGDE